MPDPAEHNHKVQQALEHLSENQPTFAIRDKGREANEQSFIWVEKGNFYAMGCISLDTELHTPDDIRENLTRYYGNHYMMQLLYAYADKNPRKVIQYDNQEEGAG